MALRPAAAAAATLAAVCLVLFPGPLLRGEVFFYRDIHFIWTGQAQALASCLRAGTLPLWDPLPSFGQPMLANPTYQAAYPASLLLLLASPWRYYTVFVLLHVLLTGMGQFVLGRRLALSPAASVAAATAWVAGGPLLSLTSMPNHLAGAAWMPWSVWAADRLAERGGFRAAAAWAVALGLSVLAGSPEMAMMGAALGLVIALRHARPPGLPRRLIGGAVLAGVLALGLSAAQALPTLELARRSTRAQQAQIGSVWTLTPAMVPLLLLAVDAHALPLAPPLRADLFGMREPYLPSIYLGACLLPFVCLGAVRTRLGRRLAVFLALALVLALGPRTLAWTALVRVLPVGNLLRYPIKTLVVAQLAWALLAGLGLDEASASGARRPSRRIAEAGLALVALAAVGLLLTVRFDAPRVAAGLLEPATLSRTPDALAPLSAAAGLVALLAALALLCGRVLTGGAAPVAIAAILTADVALAHRGTTPTASPDLYTGRPPGVSFLPDAAGGRTYTFNYVDSDHGWTYLGHGGYVMKVPRDKRPPWLEAAAFRFALHDSILPEWGRATGHGLSAQALESSEQSLLAWLMRRWEGTPAYARVLRATGIARVVSLHDADLEDLPLLARMPSLFVEDLRIRAVPGTMARAYAVSGVVIADRQPSLIRLGSDRFDPRREVILPRGVPRPAAPAFSSSVTVRGWGAERVSLDAELSHDGEVVVLETFDPWWRATVDGQAAEVLRANVLFRAVAVPAGRHRVEFSYRPLPAMIGGAISGLTLGLLAVLLFPRGSLRIMGGG